MSMKYILFGERIRRFRKSRNITQEELAEAVGISLSFLGHIERGTRKPSIETLIRIASALSTTTDELLKDSISSKRDILYSFPDPVDRFAIIRRELDLLEAECKGTKLTCSIRL